MPTHFADRLLDAIAARKTPAVVALDPVFAELPHSIRELCAPEPAGEAAQLEAVFEFSSRVLNLIAPHIPAVKINSAYFERYHGRGIDAYSELIDEAAKLGLLHIGDVKRGDVGHSAAQYALAQLADPQFDDCEFDRAPDAITVSGYLGRDGVQPFIDVAAAESKGVFVLVRTSNPSAASIQDVITADGRKLHELLAAQVAEWADSPALIGRRGYSSLGAVVATRNAADAAALRAILRQSILLVPGYGAQGGAADDFRPYFNNDGLGALIVAGRSVIFAHDNPRYRDRCEGDWEKCVNAACRDFAADIARIVA